MCGFAGFIDVHQRVSLAERERIARAMGRAIEHRGPDDWGVHDEPEAGLVLSFRRLSIIDLSEAGHQPMLSASGRSVMVFNGEIYNAREIIGDLEAAGHRFRGHSDTEAILEAFERFGVDATLPRLAGMFAIAWYDRRTRRLILVRDRLGKKPLYMANANGTLLFGSQPKSFFAHPQWQPAIDRQSVASLMRFGYVPSPRSIYSGVSSLKPAERVDIVDGKITSRQIYWNIRQIAAAAQREPGLLDDTEAKARFEALLTTAVGQRMIADVPLGAFLSGGIDSSAIVALMQKSATAKVKTFSIGFEEAEYDESKHAAAVARHLGTDHRELIVRPADAMAAIPQIPEYYDEPFADASQVPTYLLCKLTREHVTVALSGDGGDELLAGYSRYSLANEIVASVRRIPGALRPLTATALEKSPDALWRLLQPMLPKRYGTTPLAGRALKLAQLLSHATEERIFQDLVGVWPYSENLVPGAVRDDDAIWTGALADELPNATRRFQMLDMLTYLPDDILVKVDRASMAVALEVRAPLLDHRVVEFTLGLPVEMLVRNGETKWLLRQVLYDHVPRALVDRPKSGFRLPVDQWIRGPLRDWAEDLLDEQRMKADGILDTAPIRAAWTEHLSGRRNWHSRLWSVLMFQAWKRRWMDQGRS